jgi:hypothetical protein
MSVLHDDFVAASYFHPAFDGAVLDPPLRCEEDPLNKD